MGGHRRHALGQRSSPDGRQLLVETFHRDGIFIVGQEPSSNFDIRGEFSPTRQSDRFCLNREEINSYYDACIDFHNHVTQIVKDRGLHDQLDEGFNRYRTRGDGRVEMQPPFMDSDKYSYLTENAPWMPLVTSILGDVQIVHKGCFLALPRQNGHHREHQKYHQDGIHLDSVNHMPTHAVNVFVPLVDYNMENGPTEFCRGTHILGNETIRHDKLCTPIVRAGVPIIFDYRLA